MANALEQIKSKERYQLGQIRASSSMSSGYRDNNRECGVMDENQIESVKEVLEKDGKEIEEMIKTINLAKRDLAV